MSYQVLARKLRPATFDALVGQEHVVRALTHALDHGRLHHAYLFTGTRGVGKTTIARVLAKCLNCEQGVSSRPCGTCSVCREVAENRFIDLIEVDAASRTRVDDTRDLLENAQYLPTRGRYKVYLVDEVHMLSGPSFNALLKTLEEPPAHVVFLLATTDPKKIPATVLSRCLQFQLKNLAPERIARYLAEVLEGERIVHEPSALDLIATAARGSMRDALSLTDQAIAFGQGAVRAADVADMLGLVGRDAVSGLIDALAARDVPRLLALAAELAERSADFEDVLGELIAALHRMAVNQALGAAAASSGPLDPEVVQLYYQIALLGLRDLPIAPDPRLGFEMTLLRMLAFAPDEAGTAVPAARPAGQPAAPSRAQPAAPSSARPAAPSSPQSTATARPARPDGASGVASPSAPAAGTRDRDAWFELVAGLEVSGVARMLAEHSVLTEADDRVYRLRLDDAHDTLLADGPVATLERAIGARLGKPVRLDIEVGTVGAETPAARMDRERRERQRVAEEALATDQTVQQLLNEFGGRIEGVSPV
ncbi:MAG: DNA polymerase III subunit gamma/tau [Pseudomonadales bacterium]|nr:DNA polymerase III subunit gamma/tau [Pseudomonadales bacterium]